MRNEPIDFIGTDYSVGDRRLEETILPLAQERKIGVMTYFPFDRRRIFQRASSTPLPAWAADSDAKTWAQFFLKYVVSHPAVTVVRTLSFMGSKKNERRGGAQAPRKWNGGEKLQVVLEAASIPEAELGEFLRKKGIHEADLKAWRELAHDALEGGGKAAKHSAAAERRIKDLEQDIAKKDKRLKAVNALLELQKKVRCPRRRNPP